jgi:GNAT superfamily N-acetyltransferase
MSGLAVVPVRTRQELQAFIGLSFRLYRQDPCWVAPLRGQQRRQLDQNRNPFFLDAEAAYFLVRRDGRPVGRISAHLDHRYNRFHSQPGTPDTTGFFGFFECEQDPAAAAALVDAAEAWLAEHGSTQMLGPASFTFLDEAGLLVDGSTSLPTMLMAYNPPYYRPLLEGAGCTPIQDLYAWRLDASTQPPQDLVAMARSAEADYRFRSADPRHPDQEQRRFLEVVNAAFAHHWGLRPLSEEEAHPAARQWRRFWDPNLMRIAEHGEEPVGVAMTLPDVNEVLLGARGRLGPISAGRLLWKAKRRRWRACRGFVLGVKPGHRRSGVAAHLCLDTLAAARRGGYRWGELGWTLATNDPINRAIRRLGGTITKTYRLYSHPVRSS